MTHTLGPWKVVDGGDSPGHYLIEAANGLIVCETYEIGQPEDDEEAANANVLAASTDLLAACKMAALALEVAGELIPLNVYFDNRTPIETLKAAIAKAEPQS